MADPQHTPLRPTAGSLMGPGSPLPPSARRSQSLSEPSPAAVDEETRQLNDPAPTALNDNSPLTPSPRRNKPKNLKFTDLSRCDSGEKDGMVTPRLEYFTSDSRLMKDHWTLPGTINTPVLVLGDSLVNRIKLVPRSWAQRITFLSYSGCQFRHLTNILNKCQGGTFDKVTSVILVIGVNCRAQQFEATARKYTNPLLKKLPATFPNARMYFVEPAFEFPRPDWNTNLAEFTRFFSQAGFHILPPSRRYQMVDDVHWSSETANREVASWLKVLSKN